MSVSFQNVPTDNKNIFLITFYKIFYYLKSIIKKTNNYKKKSESNDKANAHLSQKTIMKEKNIIILNNNFYKCFNKNLKKENNTIREVKNLNIDYPINIKINEELKIEFNIKNKKLQIKKKIINF